MTDTEALRRALDRPMTFQAQQIIDDAARRWLALMDMAEKLLVDPRVFAAITEEGRITDGSTFTLSKTDGQWPRWAKLAAEDWAKNFIDEFCDADDLFDHLAKEVREWGRRKPGDLMSSLPWDRGEEARVFTAITRDWHINHNTGEQCDCLLGKACYVAPDWEPMASGSDPSNGTS